MKYVSIDIETTGLDPDKCQVVEIAAVVDSGLDTPIKELPAFRFICVRDQYTGDPYALSMHARLFEQIATGRYPRQVIKPNYVELWGNPNNFPMVFANWLRSQKISPVAFNVVGKNFANFDSRFLRRMVDAGCINWNYRIMDVGSMYVRPGDRWLPSTGECCERAGLYPADEIDGSVHEALFDARTVVALVRKAHQ